MTRQFDVIVFGATGFTGRLVAEYFAARYSSGELAWAMAGRSRSRLEEVRTLIGAPADLALLTADASDPTALAALVASTRVVITTVGPYQLHGEPLVRACAAAGTDYIDLCGEPGWMTKMIPVHEGPARASGARIVFSCGFDSIPFDLGLVFLQNAAQERLGEPLVEVRGRVRVIKGGLSGGTLASALATIDNMGHDPELARTMANPFALTPDFAGPAQPDSATATFDDWANAWTAPFMMATINTKNIHRTSALRGHPWGKDFVYDERMLTGQGKTGESRARKTARTTRVQNALMGFAPTRALLRRFALPKPGQGPSKDEREKGRYEIIFTGRTKGGQQLAATVKGDRDPGYGSTSKMVAESAICLLREVDRSMTAGGVWTAGSAMGLTLMRRLEQHAGLSFTLHQGD